MIGEQIRRGKDGHQRAGGKSILNGTREDDGGSTDVRTDR